MPPRWSQAITIIAPSSPQICWYPRRSAVVILVIAVSFCATPDCQLGGDA
jgi:hypothetical protein